MEPITDKQHKNTTLRWLAVLFILAAIAYLVMPIDYDGPIIGFIDDFFVFMSAFCFTFSQFSKKVNKLVRRQLYTFSISFLVLAILWIVILAYSPVLIWAA